MGAAVFAGLFAVACSDATGPEQLESLTLTPPSSTVEPQGTVQLEAVGTRAGTNVTTLIGETYEVTSGGGTVSETGLFTAPTTAGTSTITLTCGGLESTATVTVVAGPLATITVTPDPDTTAVGETQQFTAVGHDAFGNVVEITPVWSSADPPGTIDASTGLFTAGTTLGTYEAAVVATSGSISGSADVTVTAGPLATITVAPNPATLEPGDTQQFTAVGRDAAGNVVPINPVWSTTNPPGSIGASTGLFTAGSTTGTFTNSVRATSGSIYGEATVIVASGAAPLATITVTPDPATLEPGDEQLFTAVGRDADGNVVPIDPVWSTTNPPGSIDSGTGLFTAGTTTGTFNNSVRATSGSIFGEATVIVVSDPAPLATITVTPDPATLEPGDVQQFTAVGRDSDGNVVPIDPVWSTTNPPGSIDSSTGLFTAGNTTGTFDNSVRATSGSIFGEATVIVSGTVAPTTAYRMIARVAWTCTDGSIEGSIATNQTNTESPPGSATLTNCPVTGDIDIGSSDAKQAYQDFLVDYDDLAGVECGTTLTGTLAGVTLAPGVYCFDNAATLTGTLTLEGTSTDTWIIKVGEAGDPGGLTGTDFNVEMAGGASACNVSWWVRQASSMTTSNFQGHILAGAGITFTGGTYKGNAWSKEDVTVTGATVTACDS